MIKRPPRIISEVLIYYFDLDFNMILKKNLCTLFYSSFITFIVILGALIADKGITKLS